MCLAVIGRMVASCGCGRQPVRQGHPRADTSERGILVRGFLHRWSRQGVARSERLRPRLASHAEQWHAGGTVHYANPVACRVVQPGAKKHKLQIRDTKLKVIAICIFIWRNARLKKRAIGHPIGIPPGTTRNPQRAKFARQEVFKLIQRTT